MGRAERGRTRGLGATGWVVAAPPVGFVVTRANPPDACADAVAYLLDVTVRPGYNFPNAEMGLPYEYGNCDNVAEDRTYLQIMGDVNADFMADVKADFNTTDEYQASYLMWQAVNEAAPH